MYEILTVLKFPHWFGMHRCYAEDKLVDIEKTLHKRLIWEIGQKGSKILSIHCFDIEGRRNET